MYIMLIVAVLSVVKAEADYGGLLRSSKLSGSGYLTSLSECMLRAANMENIVTECSTFSDHTLAEGLLLYNTIQYNIRLIK